MNIFYFSSRVKLNRPRVVSLIRSQVVKFIGFGRDNDLFHRFVNFDGHSYEELLRVKKKVEEKKDKKNGNEN